MPHTDTPGAETPDPTAETMDATISSTKSENLVMCISKNRYNCFGLLVLACLLCSCAPKQHSSIQIPHVYQEAVKEGRLSPQAARSLRGTATQDEMMGAYVDRVEKARNRIHKLNIPKSEKIRLIHIEMKKAGKEWTDKQASLRSQSFSQQQNSE